jgi:hypothetical protein
MISMLGTLPLSSMTNRGLMAYAQLEQHQQQPIVDPWAEALRVAHSKVEAATAPGAFGHGVPDLYNLTTQDVLLIFGVAAVGSLLVYAIVNHMLHRKEKAKSDQLITRVISS